MWEPIWASRSRYWLLTGEVSRSWLHSSRTRRVRTLNVTMTVLLWVYVCWCTEGVRSPRWDRGHDEESWNGRDVKIDILDDYIRTSERFWVMRVFSEYRRVTGIRRGVDGPYWALGERERRGCVIRLHCIYFSKHFCPCFGLYLVWFEWN